MTDVRPESSTAAICRVGGGLCGAALLVFGIAGFLSGVGFLTQHGDKVFFLHTNGLLSLLSVVFGLLLLAAAAVGHNISALINTGVAALLLLSGVGNLALIRTGLNFLSFRMGNIIFSFIVGTVLLTCGLYGRVTGDEPVAH